MFHDIVLLIWPLQVFGALEYSSGAAVAGTILVSANLALYWWLGRAILMQPRLLPTFLVTLPLACCWLALWVIKIAAAVMIHKSLIPELASTLFLVGLCYLCKRIAALDQGGGAFRALVAMTPFSTGAATVRCYALRHAVARRGRPQWR